MESRTFLNYVGTGNKFSLKIKGPGDPKFVIGYCACSLGILSTWNMVMKFTFSFYIPRYSHAAIIVNNENLYCSSHKSKSCLLFINIKEIKATLEQKA